MTIEELKRKYNAQSGYIKDGKVVLSNAKCGIKELTKRIGITYNLDSKKLELENEDYTIIAENGEISNVYGGCYYKDLFEEISEKVNKKIKSILKDLENIEKV